MAIIENAIGELKELNPTAPARPNAPLPIKPGADPPPRRTQKLRLATTLFTVHITGSAVYQLPEGPEPRPSYTESSDEALLCAWPTFAEVMTAHGMQHANKQTIILYMFKCIRMLVNDGRACVHRLLRLPRLFGF